jgi:hypothetical protein
MSPLTELIGGAKVYGWSSAPGALGYFESIATVTLNSSTPSVTFSSIPQTYTHLQIRAFSYNSTWVIIQPNGSTPVISHSLYGDGASIFTSSYSSNYNGIVVNNSAASTVGSAAVIDILDYTNTNKVKTIRSLSGSDAANTSGQIWLISSLWNDTSAITSITLSGHGGANLYQYSSFALYGIKGVA